MNALVAKVLMPNLIEVNRYRISGIRPSNHPWQRMPVRSFVRSSLIIITIIIRIMRTLVRTACGLVWRITLQDFAAPRSACPTARNSEDLNSMLAGSVDNNPFARLHDDCGCKNDSDQKTSYREREYLGGGFATVSTEPRRPV